MIARVVEQDPKFTELRIVNNVYLITLLDDAREEVFGSLIAGLATSKVITDVIVTNCGVTDKIGVAFAQLLRTNTAIEELSLEQCDIRKSGMASRN